MIPITHFALGLLVAVLFVIPLVDSLNESTVLVVSGLWALVPDIGHFITELSFLHDSLWANVFWLHPTLDAIETAHPYAEATVVLSTLTFAVALVERRKT